MKRLIFGQNSPRVFETIGIAVIVLPVAISGPTAAADAYSFLPSALIECLSPGRVIYAIGHESPLAQEYTGNVTTGPRRARPAGHAPRPRRRAAEQPNELAPF